MDIVEYIKGFRFFKRCHCNFKPLKRWTVVAVHPSFSVNWHWAIWWHHPSDEYFRLRTLGFSFRKQIMMKRKSK